MEGEDENDVNLVVDRLERPTRNVKAKLNLVSAAERNNNQLKRLKQENELLKVKILNMEKQFLSRNPSITESPNFVSQNRFQHIMVMEDDTEINKCSTSQCETGNYDNVSENSAQQTSNKFEQLKNQIKQANVSTKRPYADIQSETYSTEIRNNKRANNSQLQEKKFKPPPIHIHNQSTKSTIALVKGIEINNFEVNRVSKDKHSIILKNMDDYNKTKEILNEVNTKYFSYTPKDVKPKTLVLKGLSEEENIDELKVELENLGKNKIINIIQLKTKRSSAINRKLPLYIVQFEANALLSRIYNIQFINYQRISWEQLEKKKEISCSVKTVNDSIIRQPTVN